MSGQLIATDAKAEGSYELFLFVVRSIIGVGCNRSLIDLCSNSAPLTRLLGFSERSYVDILPRNLGDEQEHFIQCDALGEHDVFNRRFDVSICFDGIEHLTKPDGFRLIDRMRSISSKQILFTPLDPWSMASPDDLNPEGHRSVWGPRDVPEYGCLLMPAYHKALGIGAFFFWNCEELESEFSRVVAEVNASGLASFST